MDKKDAEQPYPFCLASPLAQEAQSLGDASQWLAEWIWPGMRSQIIKRQGKTLIWSADGKLVNARFPELLEAAELLPDGTVIDGVILAWSEGELLPFHLLQKRLEKKAEDQRPGKTADANEWQAIPVALMLFDLLEHQGQDIRTITLLKRRQTLVQLLTPGALDETPSCRGQMHPRLRVSANLSFSSWAHLAEMRTLSGALQVKGVMLKRADSKYAELNSQSDWWTWKIS